VRTQTVAGLALVVCGCTARPPASSPTAARFQAPDALLILPADDDAPRAIGRAAPRYPHVERARRTPATVVAAFVVDTAGNVEYQTISLLETAAAPFVQSVCDALGSTRFTPAVMQGHRRRALVLASFGFAVFRDGPGEPPTPNVASYRRALADQPRDSIIARLERAPHCP
jgi:hypothetical protein